MHNESPRLCGFVFTRRLIICLSNVFPDIFMPSLVNYLTAIRSSKSYLTVSSVAVVHDDVPVFTGAVIQTQRRGSLAPDLRRRGSGE